MALSQIAAGSMKAVNQWVGNINSNIEGAARTAYKTTRVSFSDGIGISKTGSDLDVPPATLTIQATQIEWGQGAIVNSGNSEDFALQGQGFFVVADDFGRFYATRDGEFHWSGEGYLVNSAGLKVLSSGQDFIRQHRSDINDNFDILGQSRELEQYGDKSFLVVDFANLQGLKMSRYGSTTLEIPGKLPLRVQNDFDETIDGLTFVYNNPGGLPVVNDPGFVGFDPLNRLASDFSIDFGNNGRFNWSADTFVPPSPPNPAPRGLDVTLDSINTIVNAINAWAVLNGVNVTANFDPISDRFTLINDISANPGPLGNRIVFDGPNGQPLRAFFQLGLNLADNGLITRSMMSSRDIDNSDIVSVADILPGVVGGLPDAGDSLSVLVKAGTPSFTHLKLRDPGLIGAQVGGTILSDARAVPLLANNNFMAIGESQTTGEFDVSFDYRVQNTGSVFFNLGQPEPKSRANGYSLEYIPATGVVNLIRITDINTPPVILQTQALVATGAALGGGAAPTGPDHRLRVTLNDQGTLRMNVDGSTVVFNLLPDRELNTGYLSISNSGNVLELSSIRADFKGRYNMGNTGGIVSVSPTNYSTVDVQNSWQDRSRTRIIQGATEASLSSLTEYVPMLAVAQKVFTAISKIVTTYNAVVDDINSLIR